MKNDQTGERKKGKVDGKVSTFAYLLSTSQCAKFVFFLCVNGVSSTATAALASACLPLFTLHNLICVCTEHFTEETRKGGKKRRVGEPQLKDGW